MSLGPSDWGRIRELFDRIADLPADERESFLAASCANDSDAVRAEVMELLSSLQTLESTDISDEPVRRVVESGAASVVGPVASVADGARIGPYRVVRLLGTGGMGAVYLAERSDDAFQLQVAIKVVSGGLAHPGLLDRFQEERRILASLDHPNIARVIDGGSTPEGLLYLVMEYVDGVPIDRYAESHSLSVRERLELFLPVCRAVDHAHRQLVVHRDLKPDNVLVTQDGTSKLLDFGIAKLLDRSDATRLTQTESRPMTTRYASPEQIQGEPIGTASDVHSLGVLLYELLVGRHPFLEDESSRRAVEEAILNRDPKVPGLGVELDSVLLRSLEREPLKRYSSAAELSDDLERYLTGQPVEARPWTFSYRASKFVRRNAVAVGVVSAFLLTVVGAAVFSTRAYLRADRLRVEAETQRDALSEVNRFMAGIFEAASPEQTQSRDEVTARQILDAAAERIDRSLEGQPRIAATIRNELGRRYFELGLLEESEALHRKALDEHRARGISKERSGLETLVYLGQTLLAEGNLDGADSLLVEASSIAEGVEDPEAYWLVRRSLAQVHKTRGDYPAALEILQPLYDGIEGSERRVLEIRSSVANDLGNTLARVGALAEAEQMLRLSISEGEAAFGPQHSMVGERWSNLASVLREQGRQTEALDCSRRALEINETVLGEDHPSVAVARLGLADGMVAQGLAEEAEPLHDQVVEAFRAAYGDRHPRTGIAIANRAMGFLKREEYDRARTGFGEGLSICEESLGPNHGVTLSMVHNLAQVEYRAGNLGTAESICRDALSRREAALPSDHPDVIRSLTLLGDVTREAGSRAESKRMLDDATERARATLPFDNAVRQAAERGLALWLLAEGRFDQAEPLLLGVFAVADSTEGPESARAAAAAEDLVDLYTASGRADLADRYRALASSR